MEIAEGSREVLILGDGAEEDWDFVLGFFFTLEPLTWLLAFEALALDAAVCFGAGVGWVG